MAETSLLNSSSAALALRLGVIALLTGLGLAGLAQLPLEPPLSSLSASPPGAFAAASAPPAGEADLLADLGRLEALQEARQRATELLSSFVGAEMTRFFWGGFTGTLDGLGLEPPEDMAVRLTLPAAPAGGVQLELTPRLGGERYLARVVVAGSGPHGVACRGDGPVGAFVLRGAHLLCPRGWQELPFQLARR